MAAARLVVPGLATSRPTSRPTRSARHTSRQPHTFAHDTISVTGHRPVQRITTSLAPPTHPQSPRLHSPEAHPLHIPPQPRPRSQAPKVLASAAILASPRSSHLTPRHQYTYQTCPADVGGHCGTSQPRSRGAASISLLQRPLVAAASACAPTCTPGPCPPPSPCVPSLPPPRVQSWACSTSERRSGYTF